MASKHVDIYMSTHLSKILDRFVRILRDHSNIESSHSLSQNDANFQTHPATTFHVKMPNMPKIDVYNIVSASTKKYRSN